MFVIHGGCHCEKKMRIPNEGGDSTPWTITCNMYMLTPKSCSNDFPDFNWMILRFQPLVFRWLQIREATSYIPPTERFSKKFFFGVNQARSGKPLPK